MTTNSTNNVKEQVTSALDKVKEEGKSRTDRIKDIIQNAISQSSTEVKSGSAELRSIVQETFDAVVETYQDKGEAIKDEITASLHGIVNAISVKKREEIKQLQDHVNDQENALNQEVETILDDIKITSQQQSPDIKSAIDSALSSIKESEEAAMLKKRYAQLKTQLAIVQAHLTELYGGQSGEVKKYLDEAKEWYEKTKENPGELTSQLTEKQKDFEEKISKTGTLVAKKENEIKGILHDLWKSIVDIIRSQEKTSPNQLEKTKVTQNKLNSD